MPFSSGLESIALAGSVHSDWTLDSLSFLKVNTTKWFTIRLLMNDDGNVFFIIVVSMWLLR